MNNVEVRMLLNDSAAIDREALEQLTLAHKALEASNEKMMQAINVMQDNNVNKAEYDHLYDLMQFNIRSMREIEDIMFHLS